MKQSDECNINSSVEKRLYILLYLVIAVTLHIVFANVVYIIYYSCVVNYILQTYVADGGGVKIPPRHSFSMR